ncbi:MAG: PRC-barrel domain containing protein [Alphaproteobacteria bacterium]|nr:PRC-barrel domain containing protein [Alphaproteobacteria bacterium]
MKRSEAMSILPRISSATALHGISVVSPSGRRLGTLDDVIVGVTTGRVMHATILLDEPSELGEQLYAVPWEALTLDAAYDRCVLNVPIETLRAAPAFPNRHAVNDADPRLRRMIHDHFGAYRPAA